MVCKSKEMLFGYPDNTFRPQNFALRSEAFALIANYVNKSESNLIAEGTIEIPGQPADQSDVKSPEVDSKEITLSNLGSTSVTLNWSKAIDDKTLVENLQYAVYFSQSNNIKTVEDILKNGILVGEYTKNLTRKDIKELNSGSTYYFNVIVKDEYDNKTAYTSLRITTNSPSTGGVVGSVNVPPSTPTPIQETITVNEASDNVYVVNEEQASLTGSANVQGKIVEFKAKYQSVLSAIGGQDGVIEVSFNEGESASYEWSVQDIPLDIGTNNITLSLKTSMGKTVEKTMVINRVNKTIELSDRVSIFSIEDEEDANTINKISETIVNYWDDDMGTPEDSSDDQTVLLVNESNPIVTKIKQEELEIGEIVIIPPCDKFIAGWTFMIMDYGEPHDFITYPAQEFELLYVATPGIADILKGDVSLDFSGGLDPENPVAFYMFPEGVELYAVDESGEEVLIDDGNISAMNAAPKITPGMQWSNLLKMIVPSITTKTGSTSDILLKFGGSSGVVIYDKDGDIEKTKNDQIKISGESGIKNLRTTAGIEWHPKLSFDELDLLPQQVMFKTVYDKTTSFKVEYTGALTLTDVVKSANTAINLGFENKNEFLGIKVSGIDFKDCIVLGALGLRLDIPPTYMTLKGHQVTSKAVGFSPILLIMPVIDITGKIEAKVTLSYSYNSYIESGINIQKIGYTGSYGTLEANRGQKSMSLPFDRQLEIYDLEAKSSSKKNEKPSPVLKIEGTGTAEASLGLGVMTGVMVNGIVPAAVKATAYARAKATINGSAIFDNSIVPKFTGSGEVGVDAGVRVNMYAKLLAKTPLGDPGFDCSYNWEYKFLDRNISSIALKGKVTEADGDFDLTNNPSLAGVSVVAKKRYVSQQPNYSAVTDSNGNYKIQGISNGTYDVEFVKNGYITYIERGVVVSTIDKTINAILDKSIRSSLTGKILIADNDMDMSNNLPLKGAKIALQKIATSGSYVYRTTSNELGSYIINDLHPGVYQMTVESSNYVTIKQNITVLDNTTTTQNISMELLSAKPEPQERTGTAKGSIINALTGSTISGITLNVRPGMNQAIGTVIKSVVSDAKGQYTIELPIGNYTFEAVDTSGKLNLKSVLFNVKIVGGQTVINQNGIMTPIIPEGQLRIILRWGATPQDLDSHLVGPSASNPNGRFHIYFSTQDYYYDGTRYANLDVDNTTGYGPETVTIYKQTNGIYRYFVHDYSNRSSSSSSALANSGAYIEVYMSNSTSPVATFHVPDSEGTLWTVFEYDSVTGKITPINSMSYQSTSSISSLSLSGECSDNESNNDIEIITDALSQDK